MKRLSIIAVLIVMALLPVAGVFTEHAAALSGSQFQAGRIVDDGIFFNATTMDIGTIQSFLNAKVPVCDTNGAQAYGGTTRAAYGASRGYPAPYTCLKDYRQDTGSKPAETGLCNAFSAGNRSAAQIIYDVARACGVNPQVLLILLQKEQSLVTDDWPWPTQYRSATGYGCPDTAPCDAEYYGFFNQVYAAARQFKRYVRDASSFNYRAGFTNYVQFNPNGSCGGSNIYLETRSTAALYNYTPYQPNGAALANLYGEGDACSAYGNRNFWRMFNDWFGSTYGTVLLKGSGPTIYVRGSNPDVAYGVPSGEVLRAYGLEGVGLTAVSDSYLASLNTSSQLTTLFRKPLDNTIFMVDGATAYGIPSGAICTAWNLPCGNANLIADLPYAVTGALANGQTMGNLMLADNTLFAMENGTKKPFIDVSDKASSIYSGQTPITIRSVLNSSQPNGALQIYGSKFFKTSSGGAIYYYSGGQYFSFTSFDNFKNWYDGATVYTDRYSSFNSSAPNSTALSDFAVDNGTYYALSGGSKLSLPSAPTLASATNTSIYPALASLVQAKSVTPIDATKAIRFDNGSIMVLTSGELRPMPTLTDLSLFSPSSAVTAVPYSLLNGYPLGKLYVANGRVVKLSGGSTIYLYGSDGLLYGMGSASDVNAPLQWVRDPLEISSASLAYGGVKTYAATITYGGNYYAVQPDGKARLLPIGVLNSQKDTVATPLLGTILSRIPNDTRQVSFLHFNNGTIFAVQGSEIRPLSSYSTYSTMGGTQANTIEASVSSLSMFNMGSSL